MKNLTPAQITRLVGYLAAVLLGVFMVVWGVVHSDAGLVTTGLALVTTGGVAGANVGSGSRGKYAAPE